MKCQGEYSKVNKFTDVFFTSVSAMGLFMNVAMVMMTFIMYRYKYPKLYLKELGITHKWILILPFLPTIFGILGKIIIKRYKNYTFLSIIIFIGMIPSILAGSFCTLFFILIPPICSATTELSNYMEIDGDTESFRTCISEFFPAQIPVSVKEPEYFYQRYTSFFEEEINIEVSWVLPPSEYDITKQQILELKQFKNSNLSQNSENEAILSTLQPENITIEFEYNDTIKKVIYRANAIKKY